MLYQLVKPLLFSLDAERAHNLSFGLFNGLAKTPFKAMLKEPQVDDPIKLMGLTFPNRVGLAAGLDKNGRYVDALSLFGFGFIEVGTVTPLAQPGNPRPRLFRIKEVEAIVNRMGFNNEGVNYLVEQVKARQSSIPLGINIGKNKDTPAERAVDDYLTCLEKVYPYADYVTSQYSRVT